MCIRSASTILSGGEGDPKVDGKGCEMHVSVIRLSRGRVSVACMVEDEVAWYRNWLSQRGYREGSCVCTSQQADDSGMVSKAELYSSGQLSFSSQQQANNKLEELEVLVSVSMILG